jgi:hypothetical protein
MPEQLGCRAVLRTLNFGHRIAEEEKDILAKYFVETDQWRRMRSGDVDIVYGAKGAGKSALYFLLIDQTASFRASGTILITAENPRGTPVFKDLATEPPASEREFVDLWKLYFLSLLGNAILQLNSSSSVALSLLERLRDAGLLEPEGGLKALLRTVRDYVRRFSGVEGGLIFDAMSGQPSGLTGKIIFDQPSSEQRAAGAVSVDDLFEKANVALQKEAIQFGYFWID